MRVLGLTLVIALSLAGLPELVEAGGRRGFDGGRGFRGGGRHHHHHHRHPGHHHRGFAHRPFFPVFVSPSTVVSTVIAPAPLYAAPPVYAAPPLYPAAPFYAPAPAYAAPPAPPPIPRVVEYPGGRYELRGDGVASPYVWVWIPDPPAAPPPPAAPAPPAEAPEPSLGPRAPAPRSTAYRWTDDSGVTTWTDSLEKVPARFRAQAAQSAVTR
jgi:hypothetical protein